MASVTRKLSTSKITISFLNLFKSQVGRLQLILNSSVRAASKTSECFHISPVLNFINWLTKQILEYEIKLITYSLNVTIEIKLTFIVDQMSPNGFVESEALI